MDVVYYSRPHILAIDIDKTASELRNVGGSINNYNMAIDPIEKIVSGYQRLVDLEKFWDTHKNEKWRPHLKEVGRRIFEIFGGEVSKWYPTGRKPIESVAGLSIKPAIRGVRVANGRVLPCLINPRSSLLLERNSALPFIARGVFELHVRDEIGPVSPMIVDLGKENGVRANRIYFPTQESMISVEHFEDCMRKFNKALVKAGLVSEQPSRASDLFRMRQ
ncbi:MAG: hypothetical protein U1E15_05200 [Hyphomicrobiales bacterium]